jgi:glycosyltransferase involved in cell wall biosynthesis
MATARAPLKVVHLAHDALPHSTGGVEVYVARLARAQRAAGCDVELLAARDPGRRNSYEVRREVHDGLPLTTIGHRTGKDPFHALRVAADLSRFDRNPRIDRLVAGLVREAAPDVVHVHHLVHLSTSLLGELSRLGLPVVVTLHDYWWLCVAGQLLHDGGPHEPEACDERCLRYLLFNRHKAFGPLAPLFAAYTRLRARRFTRWVRERQRLLVESLGHARLVIAPSHSLAERYARSGVARERMAVSDYGTDTSAIPRRLRSLGDRPLRLGFLGRLVPEKGAHLLLEAFHGLDGAAELALFAAPAPNAGYGRKLAALAERCGARFAGAFASPRVGEVLDSIDVLVAPSTWWENSPLVIHEAFAAGVPVVAADAGGMAELVTHERDGLLFELGDAAALAHALRRMLEPGVLERLSRGTRPPRSLADDASWHLEAYQRLAARHETR